jgi:queuine tRNA-ribosyltransferase|tara:strand:+ start:27764 stop:28420 length:657 start_codon:yes stop_codon:yes gene_type:complete
MLVPSLTDEAGKVLTVSDWLSIGVTLASCDLSDLLLKPGLAVLQQLDNLAAYWDWPGELVLNALFIPNNAQGQCVIRSKYDGRILRFSYDEILLLIQQLNPEHVALPAYLLPLAAQAYPDIILKCVKYDLEHVNKPGQDALKGLMYASGDELDYLITDTKYAMDFSILDKACVCPACSDGFTRAYFHHLYVHTPLLCQRWLVMHNQYQVMVPKIIFPN